MDGWSPIDPSYLSIDNSRAIKTWLTIDKDEYQVQISYTGGLGTAQTDLPQDLIDLATLMAGRMYKEAQTGLTDAIGVQELGIFVYTKAFPNRAIEILNKYTRVTPW